MKTFISVLSVLILMTLSTASLASENRFKLFNEDVMQAYSAYRIALFQTNMKDMEKSQNSVQKFQQNWTKIIDVYGTAPPETFSSDPQWETTLKNISSIARKSAEEIKNNELAAAHETLEAIRDELSDLRRRNSVIIFSDHINNYHAVMEKLFEPKYKPENLDDKTISHIRMQQGKLNYLAEAITRNAPEAYQQDQKYQKLQKVLMNSLDQLDAALTANDPEKIAGAIKGLKPAYAKLFVNFG